MNLIVRTEIKPEFHDAKLFRGERNNNPGNLVNTPEDWLGEIVDGDDERFMQFRSAAYGIRALAKLLLNYQKKYGLVTVNGIIGRWAPKFENNTVAYAKFVAKHLGVEPNARIDVAFHLRGLVEAIILVECDHRIIYTDATLDAGINMALGVAAQPEPKATAPYIFCCQAAACTQEQAGVAGYEVNFGSATVWLPAGVFKKHALYLNDRSGAAITGCEVAATVSDRKTVRMDTALVTHVRLNSGYDLVAMSPSPAMDESEELACIEDANYRAEMMLREYLEFVLAWATNGMKRS